MSAHSRSCQRIAGHTDSDDATRDPKKETESPSELIRSSCDEITHPAQPLGKDRVSKNENIRSEKRDNIENLADESNKGEGSV